MLGPRRWAFQPSAQSTYSGATRSVRAHPLEDAQEEYLALARESSYHPEGPQVDEYDGPNDLGFWRMDIEDQAAFICNDLDLSDEQALYLLHALGLLPEGASLPDFKAVEAQGRPTDQGQPGDALSPQQLTRLRDDRDALEAWEDGTDEDDSESTSFMAVQGAGSDMAAAGTNGYLPEHIPSHEGNGAQQDALASSSDEASARNGASSTSFQVSIRPNIADPKPTGLKTISGVPALPYDQMSFDRDFEVINLRVVGRRSSTAAAMGDEIELTPGKLIAGRYQVLEQVGAAAFSRAVQAYDTLERRLVCLKVVKNDKECMDACLEEVRLLQMINARDPKDEHHIARLYDYFYHLGHLFLVVELLGGNLFDTQCYDPSYFSPGRIQSIARQVLHGLVFLHQNNIIHADVKPENILVKNYSKCSVKLIDLGCSIYNTEAHMSHYVQSRSYRAPEVMLGLPYDGRIDIWSLGCVLAELATGQVLFPNVSEAAMMARMVGMVGEFPSFMLKGGQYAGAFFTRSGRVYERDAETGMFQLLVPKRTTVQARVHSSDRGMLHFIRHLLVLDPSKRPTAEQALRHPWLQYRYRSPK
ncbi:putative serine/threonine-protein kinase [Tetrabaena socialis]|uniref:Putative serine/threonine-protein kinase n=1 Tax=Tetrabaena socialis TaxID=47790 RepID=A0A2J8AI67_9CHLO|nr:putative serine/threonine-protein kinase [Tetrabaena socialis]|eukprot:PNH12201.1 putative serine/threonine-protein kinase [Tetrabaena socialis]